VLFFISVQFDNFGFLLVNVYNIKLYFLNYKKMHSFPHRFKMISTEIENHLANVVLIVNIYKLCYYYIIYNIIFFHYN